MECADNARGHGRGGGVQEGGCLIVGYPGVAVAVVFNPFPIFLCSTHTECVTNRPRRHTHKHTEVHTHTHRGRHTHTQSHQKNSLLLTSRLVQTRFQFFLFYRDIRYTIYSIYDIILRGKGGTVVPPLTCIPLPLPLLLRWVNKCTQQFAQT